MQKQIYKPKSFNLSGLSGISDQPLEMHFGLYEGYVKSTNLLTEQLAEMIKNKKASATNPAYSELKRHLGFEYGGVILHEDYFWNFAPKSQGELSSPIEQTLAERFVSFDAW